MNFPKPINILLAGIVFLAAGPALAQYEGPGFAACMRYGEKQLMQDGTIRSVVFVNDKDTVIERNSGRAQKLRYLCLLADDQTPVFFHTTDDK